jgi:hypothetical protein
MEHVAQVPPPTPHAATSVPDRHWPLAQQPLHVEGSQLSTHVPPSHTPAPQLTHDIAPAPQAVVSRPVRQLEPAQHPLAQLDGLQSAVAHWPPLQVVPPQSRHARPPVPQAAGLLPRTHRPLRQQPAHDEGVHWQMRLRHSWPGMQAGPEPHWQEPLTQRSPPSNGRRARRCRW